jgi:hypothetical protein
LAITYSDHHLIPRSRGGGGDENICGKPHDLHAAWHHLFYNLLPWEVVAEIKTGKYNPANLSKAKKISWHLLFGEKSRSKVIKAIHKEWYPSQEIIEKYGRSRRK